MNNLFGHNLWVIGQVKEWGEILTNIETRNKYEILSEHGERIGFIAEEGGGLFATIVRAILRSHRPLTAAIFNGEQRIVLRINRPWYWIWSSMHIETSEGKALGAVNRRFRLFGRRYDLADAAGRVFGHIDAGLFRVWRFDLIDTKGNRIGEITKKWGGLVKECFTDADRFIVRLEKESTNFELQKKAVILSAAICLDLDYFENNHPKHTSS